jgi:hypothetical protein
MRAMSALASAQPTPPAAYRVAPEDDVAVALRDLAAREQVEVTNPVADTASFLGYRRANDKVGTRNEIWILCTVGCVARTAERIARLAQREIAIWKDGVTP